MTRESKRAVTTGRIACRVCCARRWGAGVDPRLHSGLDSLLKPSTVLEDAPVRESGSRTELNGLVSRRAS